MGTFHLIQGAALFWLGKIKDTKRDWRGDVMLALVVLIGSVVVKMLQALTNTRRAPSPRPLSSSNVTQHGRMTKWESQVCCAI